MDEILGLPIHPLLVHAPVILVPAFLLLAICYAAAPALRRRIGWAVMILSVLAPLSTLGGWWSGHRFYDKHVTMIDRAGADPAKFQKLLAEHLAYGDVLVWVVPALTVVVWALAWLSRSSSTETDVAEGEAPRTVKPAIGVRIGLVVLAVAVVGLSAAAGWYTFQTGHSGAKVVWDKPQG